MKYIQYLIGLCLLFGLNACLEEDPNAGLVVTGHPDPAALDRQLPQEDFSKSIRLGTQFGENDYKALCLGDTRRTAGQEELEKLMKQLGDDDQAIRDQATECLISVINEALYSGLNDPDALRMLTELESSQDPEVVRRARNVKEMLLESGASWHLCQPTSADAVLNFKFAVCLPPDESVRQFLSREPLYRLSGFSQNVESESQGGCQPMTYPDGRPLGCRADEIHRVIGGVELQLTSDECLCEDPSANGATAVTAFRWSSTINGLEHNAKPLFPGIDPSAMCDQMCSAEGLTQSQPKIQSQVSTKVTPKAWLNSVGNLTESDLAVTDHDVPNALELKGTKSSRFRNELVVRNSGDRRIKVAFGDQSTLVDSSNFTSMGMVLESKIYELDFLVPEHETNDRIYALVFSSVKGGTLYTGEDDGTRFDGTGEYRPSGHFRFVPKGAGPFEISVRLVSKSFSLTFEKRPLDETAELPMLVVRYENQECASGPASDVCELQNVDKLKGTLSVEFGIADTIKCVRVGYSGEVYELTVDELNPSSFYLDEFRVSPGSRYTLAYGASKEICAELLPGPDSPRPQSGRPDILD